MEKFVKYAKREEGAYYDYLPAGWSRSSGEYFLLQVTLGAMPLEDAFTVYLPSDYARLAPGEFFDIVFSEDEARQAEIRERLDLKANPDLPDIYADLLDTFGGWRGGRYALRFFINNGPEIDLSHTVPSYLRMRRSSSGRPAELTVLDLVIDQRPRALDYAAESGYAESREVLLHWLQERALLYAVGVGGRKVTAAAALARRGGLRSAAERLVAQQLLPPPGASGILQPTDDGKEVLAGMAAEAESYVESYDVFRDVLYDPDSGAVDFGTGQGEDLRVQVYAAEGVDPPIAVFLVSLFGPELQERWLEGAEWIADEQHFEDILAPVLDDRVLGGAEIDHVIEGGLALNEERQEEFQRARQAERAMGRTGKR